MVFTKSHHCKDSTLIYPGPVYTPGMEKDSGAVVVSTQTFPGYKEDIRQGPRGDTNYGFLIFIAILLIPACSRRARNFVKTMLGFEEETNRAITWKRNHQAPYDEWLRKFNPYYGALAREEQERFLERTLRFMEGKKFKFHSMQAEEYIPVLISAAAVQITFGLENYRMGYFETIHVIRREYVLKANQETYHGHVSRSGIYISWSHFMDGYSDYTDCINIGLHEMAHALSYDAFLGYEDTYDIEFKSKLEDFKAAGIPVFRLMRSGKYCMLDKYGASNMDEFWAVCVETFFENPLRFRKELPQLYESLVNLLNQDPLKPHKTAN